MTQTEVAGSDEKIPPLEVMDSGNKRASVPSKRSREGKDDELAPNSSLKINTARRGRGPCAGRTGTGSRLRVSEADDSAQSCRRTFPFPRSQSAEHLRNVNSEATEEREPCRDDLILAARAGVGQILLEASKSGNLKGTVWN